MAPISNKISVSRWVRRDYAIVVVIALASIWAAVASARYAVGEVLASKGLPAAMSVDSGNPIARAAQVTTLLASGKAQDRGSAIQLALSTLKREPLQASAVRALAYGKGIGGDDASARRLLQVGATISRRDLGTQLALIEYCVADDDIRCAVDHYATALATREQAEAILHPRLAAALDEPLVREALQTYIRRNEPWAAKFVRYAAQNAPDPVSVARLFERSLVPESKEYEGATSELLTRLTNAGKWSDLLTFYRHIPSAPQRVAREARLQASAISPAMAPMHWQALTSDNAGADFSAVGDRVTLHASRTAGPPVIVARKLVYAPPAAAEFRQIVELTGTSPTDAYWLIRCVAGDSRVTKLVARSGVQRVDLLGCHVAMLEFYLGAPPLSDAEAVVTRVDLIDTHGA